MSTKEELVKLIADMKRSGNDRTVIPDGVLFQSEKSARIFAEQHDKDLVEIGEPGSGWLAKNRVTKPGPMPTKEGDVVIYHLNQLHRVWVVTADGAQEPDPNIAPIDAWGLAEAEQAARNWGAETNGRIFRLQKDGNWTILPN